MTRLLALVTFFVALGLPVQAQDSEVPEKTAVLEIYLAKDDGTGKAGGPATEFGVADIPIYCIVQLNTSQPVTVKMNLVAVEVAGVKAESHVVTSSYTTAHNETRVNFTGRPHKRWVPGKYRVDVFVGNSAVGSRDFTVTNSSAVKKSPASAAPARNFVKARSIRRPN